MLAAAAAAGRCDIIGSSLLSPWYPSIVYGDSQLLCCVPCIDCALQVAATPQMHHATWGSTLAGTAGIASRQFESAMHVVWHTSSSLLVIDPFQNRPILPQTSHSVAAMCSPPIAPTPTWSNGQCTMGVGCQTGAKCKRETSQH